MRVKKPKPVYRPAAASPAPAVDPDILLTAGALARHARARKLLRELQKEKLRNEPKKGLTPIIPITKGGDPGPREAAGIKPPASAGGPVSIAPSPPPSIPSRPPSGLR